MKMGIELREDVAEVLVIKSSRRPCFFLSSTHTSSSFSCPSSLLRSFIRSLRSCVVGLYPLYIHIYTYFKVRFSSEFIEVLRRGDTFHITTMHFSNVALLLTLAISSLAAPVCSPKATATATAVAKAAPASTAAKGSAGSVLTVQNYNDFQASDGVGGNALAEVNAKFPVCRTSHRPHHFSNDINSFSFL
jgi:hypothetical protein